MNARKGIFTHTGAKSTKANASRKLNGTVSCTACTNVQSSKALAWTKDLKGADRMDRYINATKLIATLEGAIERAEREESAGIEKLMAVTSMKYAKRLLEEASKTEGERG